MGGKSALARTLWLCGLALVENAYDETGLIEAVAPTDFLQREKELLVKAKAWMPRLPFPRIDLLIVDEIGKVLVGQHDLVTGLLIGLFTKGHILIEGVPGLAKTLLVSTVAATMAGAIGILASIARWGAIFGGGRDDDNNVTLRSPFVSATWPSRP